MMSCYNTVTIASWTGKTRRMIPKVKAAKASEPSQRTNTKRAGQEGARKDLDENARGLRAEPRRAQGTVRRETYRSGG